MDPATFKLVLEHQKEYSVQDKTIRSHDPITIARKKQFPILFQYDIGVLRS